MPEVSACQKLTDQWLRLTLAYLGLSKLRYPYKARLRTGETLILREFADLIVFWLIFVRGHYPVDASLKMIVDVGANIGVFTLYAARAAPSSRIIAVEPFPETCERLHEMIRLNTWRIG
jgi:tRNA G46 methylase TrmB